MQGTTTLSYQTIHFMHQLSNLRFPNDDTATNISRIETATPTERHCFSLQVVAVY